MSKAIFSRAKVATSSLTGASQEPSNRYKPSLGSLVSARAKSDRFGVSMGPGSTSVLRRKGAEYLLEGLRALKTSAGAESGAVAATKAEKSKKPLNAYQLFQKDPAVQEQVKGRTLSDRSKEVSKLWKGLSEVQKSKYETEAEAGGAFKAKKQPSGGGKGYSAFVAQEYASTKKEQGIASNEMFKALGQKWKAMSAAEKDKYNK